MRFLLLTAALVSTLSVHAADITGTVLDSDGKPIPNAKVLYFLSGPDLQKSVVLKDIAPDAKGAFRIPGEKVYLFATAPGYVPQMVGQASGEAVKIVLQKAAPVLGKVVDGVGNPVAGVKVKVLVAKKRAEPSTAYTTPLFPVPGYFEGTTDDKGIWAIAALPAETDAIFVIDDPKYLAETTDDPKKPILAKPAGRVRGRVLNPDGKPGPAVQITVVGSDGNWHTGVTSEAGEFTVGQLPGGEHRIVIQSRRGSGVMESKAVSVSVGSELSLGDLALISGVVLRGRVVEKGTDRGAEGIQVSASDKRVPLMANGFNPFRENASTDKDGFWSVRVLPGEVKLSFYSGGNKWMLPSDTTTLSVPDQAAFDAVSPMAERTPVARLKVVDETGKPLAGVPLYVSVFGIQQATWTNVTDKEGKWSSEGDDGSLIRIGADHLFYTTDAWEVVSPEKITAPFPTETKVVMRPNRKAPVTGRVVDVEGKPVAQTSINVYVYPRGKSRYEGRNFYVTTDDKGEYRVTGGVGQSEEVALYPFVADTRIVSVGEQKNGAPRLTDTIVERFTSKAAGKVVDGAGKPVAGALVWNAISQSSATTGVDGKFALPKFPQRGGWIGAGKGNLSGSVQAEPGANNLTLTLAPPPVRTPAQLRQRAEQLISQVRALAPPGRGVRNAEYERDFLSQTVAWADSRLALEIGRDASGKCTDATVGGIVNVVDEMDPLLAERLTRPGFEELSSIWDRYFRAAERANGLWATRPDLARFWLARALKEADGVGADRLAEVLFVPALVLGGAELTDILSRLEKAGKKTELATLHMALQPSRADELLSTLPEKGRTRALAQAVTLLSKTSGLGLGSLTQKLLALPSSEQEYEIGTAVAQAIRKLGKADPKLALKLAEGVQGYYKTAALVLAAQVQPDLKRKEELLRGVLFDRNGGDTRLATLIAIEEVPALRGSIGGQDWEMQAIGFAKIDPARARRAAELAVQQTLSNAAINEPDTARGMRRNALIPLAALDPLAALRLIETLDDPTARAGGKAWAATMLLLPLEKRLEIARKKLVYYP